MSMFDSLKLSRKLTSSYRLLEHVFSHSEVAERLECESTLRTPKVTLSDDDPVHVA